MRLLKKCVLFLVVTVLAWPVMAENKQGKGNPDSKAVPECAEFKTLESYMAARPKWNFERVEKETFNKESLIFESDKTPVDIVLRRTRALLKDLQGMPKGPSLKKEAAELVALSEENVEGMPKDKQVELFMNVAALRRKIAFQNPLLDFDKIVFLKKPKQIKSERHMCDQMYGHNAGKGGGVFVLEGAFSDKPSVRDLLAESAVQDGRLKGQKLQGGNFSGLDLDYDGQSILFAYAEHNGQPWTEGSAYHIYGANADGSELTMLTDGKANDFDPCFLPSGRIVFISGRIGGFGRCHGRPVPTYTLHGMMRDGSDIITLSWHDTNEWHPSVDNNGMIIYTRWDYVDRDSDIAHHIWHTFPDGRDPRSYHGNYPDVREARPWMEMHNRSIPNSHRYIATAAGHHGQNFGSLVMIDLRVPDDREMSQVKRVTPEIYIPESEVASGVIKYNKGAIKRAEVYGTAWPLSENYYICVYDPSANKYGVCLLDAFGNKEMLFQDDQIPCFDAIPLKPRKRPPVIPVQTIQAKADRTDPNADLSMGTVTIMNVYESEFPFPEGTKIKELRIINIFSKATIRSNSPNIGLAAQSLARGVLGTVPVEEDGSVHFKAPTGTDMYFQVLDEKGMVVQSMKSSTYLHPGETLSCVGCHEKKESTPRNMGGKMPMALKREPSIMKPEAEGSYPLTFARLVQPVIDKKCVGCHDKNKDKEKKAPGLRGDVFTKNGWSEAFNTLHKYAWGKHGGNGAIRRNGLSYSIPGKVCANASKLYAHLTKEGGHHKLELSPEEMRRITLWIDCNSNFYGAYLETDKQARGEIVKPKIGLPPWIDFDELVR